MLPGRLVLVPVVSPTIREPTVRRKEEPCEGQRDPQRQECREIAEQDVAQSRRPREGKRRANAAGSKREHLAYAEGEARDRGKQPVIDRLEAQLVGGAVCIGGDAAEQPFGAEAERYESCDQRDDSDDAEVPELLIEDTAYAAELGGNGRQGREDVDEMRADRGATRLQQP
jgi:hypothetical protein